MWTPNYGYDYGFETMSNVQTVSQTPPPTVSPLFTPPAVNSVSIMSEVIDKDFETVKKSGKV